MKLTLGFSPCPNDTYIFDALANNRIDTEGIEFECVLEDVEALNQMAVQNKLDITKLSYFAFGKVSDTYILLNAGSALGYNCGPILISKRKIDPTDPSLKIAIPGALTTANFLLSVAFPALQNKEEYLFSEIEQAVLDETVDAGLIIHENRFTYQEKGLKKVRDLGEFWQDTYQVPIPLGGICIKRDLPAEVKQKVDRVIKRSLAYAFDKPDASKAYVAAHAQEMEYDVRKAHIDLYVNEYSLDLGENGRKSIEKLFSKAIENKVLPALKTPIILPK